MYWFRNSDGTCTYGDIYISRYDSLHEFVFKTDDVEKQSMLESYLVNNRISLSDKDSIYQLLYGYNEEQLIAFFEQNHRSKLKTKEWDKENIFSINIHVLISSVLLFVYSKCSFEDKIWVSLKKILMLVLSGDDLFWQRISSGENIPAKEFKCWFIKFISEELSEKVLGYLSDEQCFICYLSLTAVKSIIDTEVYDRLEKTCCELFDELAVSRLNDNKDRTFNLYELETFSIDVFFFLY